MKEGWGPFSEWSQWLLSSHKHLSLQSRSARRTDQLTQAHLDNSGVCIHETDKVRDGVMSDRGGAVLDWFWFRCADCRATTRAVRAWWRSLLTAVLNQLLITWSTFRVVPQIFHIGLRWDLHHKSTSQNYHVPIFTCHYAVLTTVLHTSYMVTWIRQCTTDFTPVYTRSDYDNYDQTTVTQFVQLFCYSQSCLASSCV